MGSNAELQQNLTKLPHNQHVQRRVQFLGNLLCYGHASTWQAGQKIARPDDPDTARKNNDDLQQITYGVKQCIRGVGPWQRDWGPSLFAHKSDDLHAHIFLEPDESCHHLQELCVLFVCVRHLSLHTRIESVLETWLRLAKVVEHCRCDCGS